MKFRLVEELSEEEKLDEATVRGETSLRECLCSLLEWKCGIKIDPTRVMLHHKDGNHGNNDIRNLILLPITDRWKNPNSHLHGMQRSNKLELTSETGARNKKYRAYLDELDIINGIDIFNSLRCSKLMSVKRNIIDLDP